MASLNETLPNICPDDIIQVLSYLDNDQTLYFPAAGTSRCSAQQTQQTSGRPVPESHQVRFTVIRSATF